jgi:anaerobic dimethyl sulfoxide reductase subunit B (iron-sulfur subunit)
MAQYGFYFDQSRCVGCNACTVACKQWHELPPGPQKWMRVYQWETGAFPEVRVHFLAIPCYHCERPVCMKACPSGAIYKEGKYGAVLIDPAKCTGSRKCWKACPYGSIFFASDSSGEKASKCTMCIDRLHEGKTPICVLSCSMRALEFGPIDQLASQYGNLKRLEEMPTEEITRPAVVFKRSGGKRPVIPWDAEHALRLWKDRGSNAPPEAPALFRDYSDVTEVPPATVGRDRLVLKPRNTEELMYYTTDDD